MHQFKDRTFHHPMLADCKNVLGVSFGNSDITPSCQYFFNNKEEFTSFPKQFEYCDNLETKQKSLVILVEDLQDKLWFDILTSGFPLQFNNHKMKYLTHPVTCKTHGIQILLAVYGLQECTNTFAQILEDQEGNELFVRASNSFFGDSWPNVGKTLTLVYRVQLLHGEFSETRVKVVRERELMIIDLVEELNEFYSKANDCFPFLQPTIRKQRHRVLNNQIYTKIPIEGINIVAAAYGPIDVTEKVRQLSQDGNRSLKIEATNRLFGDAWYGVKKYLVVFYRIDKGDEIFVSSVMEGSTLMVSQFSNHVLASPSNKGEVVIENNLEGIRIYGAVVGNSIRTMEMKQLLETNEGADQILTMN